MSPWEGIADRSLALVPPSRDEARGILAAPAADVLPLLQAAFRVRQRFHGRRVRLHVLENAKSGSCPEDCGFCSQSSRYATPAETYALETVDQIVQGAVAAKQARAWKYCIVTATRGPSPRDLDTVCEAVRKIKATIDIKVCASLGLLNDAAARRLAEAGVDRFNHNLETSKRFFGDIVQTHGWEDRANTCRTAKAAGMEICSGGIVGMGETDDDVIDLCFALRELGADSIPVNFLDPRPGTPLAGRERVTPAYCLQVLCLFRFAHPDRDVRIAGGREVNLRSLQPLALYAANSMFTSGYLTTPGNAPSDDHQMIRDLGFEIEEVADGAARQGPPEKASAVRAQDEARVPTV